MTNEELDREIAAGTQFTLRRDPEDPRFDLISLRIPNPRMMGDPDAPLADESILRGIAARWRFLRFATATTAGVAELFGMGTLHGMLKILFNEIRVQEVSMPREDVEASRAPPKDSPPQE